MEYETYNNNNSSSNDNNNKNSTMKDKHNRIGKRLSATTAHNNIMGTDYDPNNDDDNNNRNYDVNTTTESGILRRLNKAVTEQQQQQQQFRMSSRFEFEFQEETEGPGGAAANFKRRQRNSKIVVHQQQQEEQKFNYNNNKRITEMKTTEMKTLEEKAAAAAAANASSQAETTETTTKPDPFNASYGATETYETDQTKTTVTKLPVVYMTLILKDLEMAIPIDLLHILDDDETKNVSEYERAAEYMSLKHSILKSEEFSNVALEHMELKKVKIKRTEKRKTKNTKQQKQQQQKKEKKKNQATKFDILHPEEELAQAMRVEEKNMESWETFNIHKVAATTTDTSIQSCAEDSDDDDDDEAGNGKNAIEEGDEATGNNESGIESDDDELEDIDLGKQVIEEVEDQHEKSKPKATTKTITTTTTDIQQEEEEDEEDPEHVQTQTKTSNSQQQMDSIKVNHKNTKQQARETADPDAFKETLVDFGDNASTENCQLATDNQPSKGSTGAIVVGSENTTIDSMEPQQQDNVVATTTAIQTTKNKCQKTFVQNVSFTEPGPLGLRLDQTQQVSSSSKKKKDKVEEEIVVVSGVVENSVAYVKGIQCGDKLYWAGSDGKRRPMTMAEALQLFETRPFTVDIKRTIFYDNSYIHVQNVTFYESKLPMGFQVQQRFCTDHIVCGRRKTKICNTDPVVIVTKVEPNSTAHAKGIHCGDILCWPETKGKKEMALNEVLELSKTRPFSFDIKRTPRSKELLQMPQRNINVPAGKTSSGSGNRRKRKRTTDAAEEERLAKPNQKRARADTRDENNDNSEYQVLRKQTSKSKKKGNGQGSSAASDIEDNNNNDNNTLLDMEGLEAGIDQSSNEKTEELAKARIRQKTKFQLKNNQKDMDSDGESEGSSSESEHDDDGAPKVSRETEKIDINCNTRQKKWIQGLLKMKEYHAKHGDYFVPYTPETKSMRNWYYYTWSMGNKYLKGEAPNWKERYEIVNKQLPGFQWVSREEQRESKFYDKSIPWEAYFEMLKEYKQQHGHCNVPRNLPNSRSHSDLAGWVQVMRALGYGIIRHGCTSALLTPERFQKMDDIGFSWFVKTTEWFNKYERLKKYKEEHGDCLVPKRFAEDYSLGVWVFEMRKHGRNYLAGRKCRYMTDERYRLLNELGFTWYMPGKTYSPKDTYSFRKQEAEARKKQENLARKAAEIERLRSQF